MARKFNGTTDAASVAIDLSGFNKLLISFWLWMDSIGTGDAMALTFFKTPISDSSGGFQLDFGNTSCGGTTTGFVQMINSSGGGVPYWRDGITLPSTGAWHHYLVQMNRATPLNTVYIDGALATLVSCTHSGGAFNNFSAGTLSFLSRNGSLNVPGRIAEFCLWGGSGGTFSSTLMASMSKALFAGAQVNGTFPGTPSPSLYVPFLGADSPEPDYSGSQHSVTLTGTTPVNPPGTRSVLGPSQSNS